MREYSGNIAGTFRRTFHKNKSGTFRGKTFRKHPVNAPKSSVPNMLRKRIGNIQENIPGTPHGTFRGKNRESPQTRRERSGWYVSEASRYFPVRVPNMLRTWSGNVSTHPGTQTISWKIPRNTPRTIRANISLILYGTLPGTFREHSRIFIPPPTPPLLFLCDYLADEAGGHQVLPPH